VSLYAHRSDSSKDRHPKLWAMMFSGMCRYIAVLRQCKSFRRLGGSILYGNYKDSWWIDMDKISKYSSIQVGLLITFTRLTSSNLGWEVTLCKAATELARAWRSSTWSWVTKVLPFASSRCTSKLLEVQREDDDNQDLRHSRWSFVWWRSNSCWSGWVRWTYGSRWLEGLRFKNRCHGVTCYQTVPYAVHLVLIAF
jgi:hypothetical protein